MLTRLQLDSIRLLAIAQATQVREQFENMLAQPEPEMALPPEIQGYGEKLPENQTQEGLQQLVERRR